MAHISSANDRRPPLALLLLGIFLRPAVSLRAIARAPAHLWLVPFLLAIVLLSARVAVSAPLEEERRLATAMAAWQAQLEGFPKEKGRALGRWSLAEIAATLVTLGLRFGGGLGTYGASEDIFITYSFPYAAQNIWQIGSVRREEQPQRVNSSQEAASAAVLWACTLP